MRVEIERGIEQRQCPSPDTAPRFARACGRQTPGFMNKLSSY